MYIYNKAIVGISNAILKLVSYLRPFLSYCLMSYCLV